MKLHLSPIESIREMRKQFELLWGIAPPESLKGKKGEDIKSHINLTLTSFIEAEIEKWEGEKIKYGKFVFKNGKPKAVKYTESYNSAISSVIEHLQEIKKQI